MNTELITTTPRQIVFMMIAAGLFSGGCLLVLIKIGNVNYNQIENISIVAIFLSAIISWRMIGW